MNSQRSAPSAVVVEDDGGSRGNPGPEAYGAVLKDAATGEVIAEDGTAIGVASNNVAEYRGLIAGLRMAAELTPDADVEVRMDSRLVVEQMSGHWKIKHPDMKPLALEANRLAPLGTLYTWIPREQNKHADRLVNEALDGKRSGMTVAVRSEDDAVADVAVAAAIEGDDMTGADEGAVWCGHCGASSRPHPRPLSRRSGRGEPDSTVNANTNPGAV